MTFYQARAISQTSLHVRRSSWPDDQWFMIWRGTWFIFASGNPPRPVRATDYSAAELIATDWTTMPAALAACPIDPTIGSTGGGDPTPGSPGFPDDPTPPIGGVAGSSIPPGPDDPDVIPTPDPGTGVSVTFAGIIVDSAAMAVWTGINLNQTFTLTPAGAGVWTLNFANGKYISGGADLNWTLTATRTGSLWDVELAPGAGTGGFVTQTPAGMRAAGMPIVNDAANPLLNFSGGTATVGGG